MLKKIACLNKIMSCSCLLLCMNNTLAYADKVVNAYIWGGEIPSTVIQQFEKDTGIKVNFSTYDSNETMYAKLKTSHQTVYDVVMASGYFVERMRNQGLLSKIDHKKLPNIVNLSPEFTKSGFDPGNEYSVPLNWGITGIFYNSQWVKNPPTAWHDLWEKKWHRQLLLLDDPREIFSIGLMKLGYNPNDKNPEHIKKAYKALLELAPNIKMFASDSVQAIIIDEDAKAGSAWNGDAFKAQSENKAIKFVYPAEGFVIWVDCLTIPANPPHKEEAYQFINYMLKPEIAAEIAKREGHASTNAKGKALLPPTIRNNVMIYPPSEILKRGYVQRDVGDKTIAIFNHYWEQLKFAL